MGANCSYEVDLYTVKSPEQSSRV